MEPAARADQLRDLLRLLCVGSLRLNFGGSAIVSFGSAFATCGGGNGAKAVTFFAGAGVDGGLKTGLGSAAATVNSLLTFPLFGAFWVNSVGV